MRLGSVLLLTCLLGFGSGGCMVLDEVDAANQKMADFSNKKPVDEEAEDEDPVQAAATRRSQLLESSREWWDKAKSYTPGEKNDSIVRCRLPEGGQYMTREDCLARGGRA